MPISSLHGSIGERCFLRVFVGANTLYALPDTGADHAYLGQRGYEVCKKLGLLEDVVEDRNKVQLADGSCIHIIGTIKMPIQLKGKVSLLNCRIVPELKIDLILGREALCHMGLVINLVEQVWYYQKRPLEIFEFDCLPEVEDTEIKSKSRILSVLQENSFLSEAEMKELEVFLSKELPLFDRVTGKTDRVEHVIDTGTAKPIKQRYYPVSPAIHDIILKQVDKMLQEGIIEPSQSPWSAPVVLVKKPNGDYRFCIDYRKLNEVTKRDSYPLPYIDFILSKLKGAKYLSTLDLRNGYWQVPLSVDSKEKTAFVVPGRGLFQFRVLPFGLHNAPATFQRMIESVLSSEINDSCFCYLDDIIVVSDSFHEHLQLLEQIFRKLRDAGLKINIEKSKFCREGLKYLGHIVSKEGISVDPEKVSCITMYPIPQNVKQLKSFLGLVSWYRRFIPNFSNIIFPLNTLLRKNVKWLWSDECQKAFDEIKTKLLESPILSCPDYSKPLVLQTDASFSGLGAVLTQDVEGQEKVIAFASRSLSDNERKFSVTEKELLAVLWAIQKFRPYLEGYHFILITDHFALKWINGLKNPSGRLARWSLLLQEHSFTVVHRKGTLHKVPDALSRIPENSNIPRSTSDVENQYLAAMHLQDFPIDFANIKDPWFIGRRKQVLEEPDKWPDWQVSEDRLYHYRLDQLGQMLENTIDKWKLVIPREFRSQVLKECHDEPQSGHLGIAKTFLRISQKYYWPGMFRDVARYVKSCEVCQRHKVEQRMPAGKMGFRTVEKPWSVVTTDILGPYPISKKRNRYIVIFQDNFTKWIEAKPVRVATTKTVLEAFHELVILRWGVPEILLSDNGPQYVSQLMKAICETYNIKLVNTPLYTPQSNPTERANRVLKTMVSCYIGEKHVDWDLHLSDFCFAMNTSVHSATKYTPAYLNLGRELKSLSVLNDQVGEMKSILPVEWEQKIEEMKTVYLLVRKNLEDAYHKSSHYYNLRRRSVKFRKGDRVLRKNFVLSSAFGQISAGLAPKYLGPYKVEDVISSNVYELIDAQGRSAGRWHIKDLKPYMGR